MKTWILSLIVSLLFIGCASTNPFSVPKGRGALLINTSVERDSEYYAYGFHSADGRVFRDEWFMPKGRYTIPAGTRKLGIIVMYAPKGIGISFSPKRIYTYTGYVNIDAVEGLSYRARCKIIKGKAMAKIWVEDASGNRVSDISDAVAK